MRRLSLVALLLSRRGQPVSAAEIRERVEGYPGMTDEAFKRRFYEDRVELGELGIGIRSEDDPLADASTEVYSLPADAYYLQPVAAGRRRVHRPRRLSRRPRGPLRLLAAAAPRPAQPRAGAPRAPHRGGDAAAARSCRRRTPQPPPCPSCRRRSSSARRSTFSYYAITRDQKTERVVDPYGLQLVAGEWYLIGHCHLREAVRTFRALAHPARASSTTRAGRTTSPRRRTSTSRVPRPARLAAGEARAGRRASASPRPWRGGSRRTGRTAAR